MKLFRILLIESFLFLIFFGIMGAQSYTSEINVEKGAELYVYSDAGKVDIFIWNKDKVGLYCSGGRVRAAKYEKNIDAKIYAQSNISPKTEIYLPEDINIYITSAGGDIEFHNKYSGKLKISASSGNINVADLNNDAELSTGGGDIHIGNIEGDLKIYETVGNIKVNKITGTANINTSGGDIIIKSVGKSLYASTNAGKIEIGDVGNFAKITNKSGNIKIENIKGSSELNSTGGDIEVKSGGGAVSATTTGGDIGLGNIRGFVVAKTDGGKIVVNLFPEKSGKSILISGMGDIILNLSNNTKPYIYARIKIQDDWEKDHIAKTNKKPCEIKSDFNLNKNSFRLDEKTSAIEGKSIKHSGSETIYLETTNSNIEIRKLKK